ncbi:chemotaxis protein CheW [Roseateles sp.]|uniref:chemotaxis protein CheW n=1 Tax=Roseateles sp. TaxID=1971397 RepID=UPI0025CB864E|nr:chemotaxis protein CheW [Roseateles sp.]MBV8035904.1 chemotaxis protein CheW [Roseateles sp.]
MSTVTNALALAAPPSAGLTQYLSFNLAREVFAIGILAVKEIIEFKALTEVPMMPASVRGVINLRGAVVPVVDLAQRFGRAASQVGKRSCIVIVETGTEEQGGGVLGVLVDSVREVLDIPSADIEPAPSFGAQIRRDFIAGIGKVRGDFVILLDLSRVLSLQEIGALTDGAVADFDPVRA